MLRRLWAVALAVLMIASALMVAVPLSHTATSPAVGTTPSSGLRAAAVTGIEIIPIDGYGGSNYYFDTGGGPYGTVYFEVREFGTAPFDLSANVTISDPNASRDGVGSPALRLEVPLNPTSGEYNSWEYAVHYTIPNVPYGGLWNITAQAPLGGWDNETFQVSSYYVSAGVSLSYPWVVLPAETFTLTWLVSSNVNDAPYNAVTNVTLEAGYYATVSGVPTYTPFFSGNYWKSLPAAASGTYTITIPANATPLYDILIEVSAATVVHGQVAENETAYQYIYVGEPQVRDVYLSQTPNACGGYSDSDLSPGVTTFVCIYAVANYYGSVDPVPAGLTVMPRFWNGTAWVVPTGGAPTSLTTNMSGYASFTFDPTFPPFTGAQIYGYYNTLNVTVNYTQATSTIGQWYTGYNASFFLSSPAQSGNVQVVLSQSVYWPGETVTATWTLGASDPTSIGSLTATYWALVGSDSSLLGLGTISSSASTGTVSVPLPAGYVGSLELEVIASNASSEFYGYAYAYASPPTLAINLPGTYSAGNSLSVQVSGMGVSSWTGWTIGYTVWAYYETPSGEEQGSGLVATGTVANDSSFTISVPSASPPAYYEVYAWLESSTQGVVATQQAYSDLVSGYGLLLGIQTQSKYSDGSFQPGETITISYQITNYGATTLPTVFSYYVYMDDTPFEMEYQGNSPSGTFQVTIPSNQPAGAVEVEMEMEGTGLSGPNCDNTYCYAWTLLAVNPSPSALEMYVGGASSGLTVGWLILLIVIIVVAVLAVVLALRRRRSPPSSSSMPPPAPAPSSAAPPEWKEPAPADSNQPPMPSPPPGAQ